MQWYQNMYMCIKSYKENIPLYYCLLCSIYFILKLYQILRFSKWKKVDLKFANIIDTPTQLVAFNIKKKKWQQQSKKKSKLKILTLIVIHTQYKFKVLLLRHSTTHSFIYKFKKYEWLCVHYLSIIGLQYVKCQIFIWTIMSIY